MKKIFIFSLFAISILVTFLIFPSRSFSQYFPGDPGGGGPDGFVPGGDGANDCGNYGPQDAPGGDITGGGGGTTTPACIPDGQSCPAVESLCCSGSCNNGVCGQPPPPPANPTQIPACGTPCSGDYQCAGAKDGCTSCVGQTKPDCSSFGAGYQLIQLGANYYCQNGKSTVPAPGGGGAGTCQAPNPTVTPPINCGSSCVKDSDCAGAAVYNCGACINNVCAPTPTPTIPINCGSSCVKDSDCAGAAVYNCGACVNNKCAPPPPNCGSSCVKDSDCAGASVYNCGACVSNKCAPPPPQCGTACTKASDCNGAPFNCTACVNNKCGATPTPTFTPTPTHTPTPTPTPLPPKPECDGITYTSLVTGQYTTITSYAVVDGPNAAGVKVTSQSMFLSQGADDNHGKIILQSGPIATSVVSSSATHIRYKSTWTFKFPQLVSGNTYRIWSNIQYSNITGMSSTGQVAGISTSNQTFIGKLIAFVRGIFGMKQEKSTTVAVTSQPVKIAATSNGAKVLGTSSLQLQTINPIEVYFKGCYMIKLRYNF